MVKVEKIKESELNELSKLYFELGNKESNKYKMKEIFDIINSNPQYYLLGIKNEGILIGTAMVIVCNDLFFNCQPFIVVENVIVSEKHQRKGYGSLLFEEIDRIAKENNCYYIMLLSNKRRQKSHEFYKKMGYKSDDNLAFKKYL